MGALWEPALAVCERPESESVEAVTHSVLLWARVLERLSASLDPQMFNSWIKPLEMNGIFPAADSTEVVLTAPNRFTADHISRSYGEHLKDALEQCSGFTPIRLRFEAKKLAPRVISRDVRPIEDRQGLEPGSPLVVKESSDHKNASAPQGVRQQNPSVYSKSSTPDESNLNNSYNFSNFVVGSCNQLSHAVSLQVSENLGRVYNPLFLYGGVGLGKTHLVNAIGNAARRRGKKVLLVSSETFVNELITAIRSNRMPQFKSKFRSLDLLIIDDVQFISGKERTQEEFFHTFNELHQKNKQIVVTADKLPQDLTGVEDRLRTRFASGLSADLQLPDFETRVAIINKKAEVQGISLSNEVAQFLAARVDTNVRELEGALNRLVALSKIYNSPLSLALCEEAVKDLSPEIRTPLTIDLIQRKIAEHYSVGLTDLIGKRRTQNIAFARHVAMYLCRKYTSHSYPEIGALFGGRDHSTVIHANRVIEERLTTNPSFKAELSSLSKVLKSEDRPR